jgi:hypothetical protein
MIQLAAIAPITANPNDASDNQYRARRTKQSRAFVVRKVASLRLATEHIDQLCLKIP